MPAKPWKRNLARVHLDNLCGRAGIKIKWANGRGWMDAAEAFPVARTVVIPEPYRPVQYLVALHEIGHVLARMSWADRTSYEIGEAKMMYEAAAWGWAVTHIHPTLDKLITEKDFQQSLGVALATHAWDLAIHAED